MTDRDYMLRAIELAKKGCGWVDPNPLVGAVIVKDGRIIGEGYHAKYGDLHAERNALKNLTESAEGATIYVTLEPCCHHGKQPPCTDALLEHKIARVVIGSRDPNPLVSGKGAAILRAAGVLVEEDFMREECDALNDIFFHYITKKRPYVMLKYAMTADGKIATHTGASKWITGTAARELVQEMRSKYFGIMVGIGTVLADDPMLNCRLEGKRSPVRIICDSHLRIPLDCQLVKTAKSYRTLIACCLNETELKSNGKYDFLQNAGLELLSIPSCEGKVDLDALMDRLGQMGINSILLEGGGGLNDSALQSGIVQEVSAFIAPKIFGGAGSKSPVEGKGISLPCEALPLSLYNTQMIGEDILLQYKVKRRKSDVYRNC